jgi:hypothetical protein
LNQDEKRMSRMEIREINITKMENITMNYSRTRKIITVFTTAALLMASGIPSAMAEEEVPAADASVSFYSTYVWRGFGLSDDSIVIQPSMTVGYKGLAMNLWGNLDTDYYAEDTTKYNETDITLSYDGAYEKLGYGVGYIYYALDGAADTQEIYGTLSYDVLLSPTLAFYYDVDDFSGAYYVTFDISHSFPIGETYSLDLGALVSYLDDNEDYNAFHNGVLSASMTFPIGEYISITPEVNYSFALSNDAEDYIKDGSADNDDSYIYGGTTISFAF